ncbi:MAG: GNAT family N-acetyltransferase [Thermomicrobiales bacterium]
MTISFSSVELSAIKGQIREHLETLPSKIEDFMEEHIRASLALRIEIDGVSAGFAAIHSEKLITQFSLKEPFRQQGQVVFARLRKMEQVTSAFVPTCDEFYLAHALDDHRQVLRQAYFFATTEAALHRDPPDGYRLEAAVSADAAMIREVTGDFFEPVDERIAREELFLNWRGNELVGFGIKVDSYFYAQTASIGMFTIERYRGAGAGSATIAQLISMCGKRGIRPVAGCWYYNHRSKRTLERAGMYSPTRLLRIEY